MPQSASTRNSARNRRKNRKRRKLLNKPATKAAAAAGFRPPHSHHSAQDTSSTRSPDSFTKIWQKAVSQVLQWQTQYRAEYWRHLANRRQLENRRLCGELRRLTEQKGRRNAEDHPAAMNGNSGAVDADGEEEEEVVEEVEDEHDSVDAGYLQFLEVSMRHQMQRDMERRTLDE